MIFKILATIWILLSAIVIDIEWKRIESLEQWVLHLVQQIERKENER